ncbi:alanine--tRNA ligase [Alkalispirochaeta sphaeroplastigenens]|uniref:Alanine--tRNA ligase n=1 Tax=Alkalispirochaeta sphaeroplastigenens TaxID=1187066 RepID=A0A2S4JWU9_9SPIO|nr:alanine--tRNA ligase [Alkalispirochaeta sphaeroplastigenens]POR04005.1 alanine--tRNA ligase [Alkalispirochaeta sphaeroplastigenens]
MTAQELRRKYIDFFKARGHAEISGKSLIPENDPTVLFTTAGMHPLVPYLLGEPHPAGTRLVDVQKCIRTGDIDEVGDESHLTFFEMLGNWSLGDYFKEEAIRMSWEFLTSPEWLGIDPQRISVTVFGGDDDVPRDEESAAVWRDVGVPAGRIHYLGRKDNWWGPAGQTGPCGPDSEMFIDTGIEGTPGSRPGVSDGKYLEIWNDVFMQYNKQADGSFLPLERTCVDTGMGVERTIAILQGKRSVYDTEVFQPILACLEGLTGHRYGADQETDRSLRIIADHARTATFVMGDENPTVPSNMAQGYVLRRLIRRAMRHGRKLGLEGPFLAEPVRRVIETYAGFYPLLEQNRETILQELHAEEDRFLKTLQNGEREFEKMIPNLMKGKKREIPGRLAFKLYDTYGFPLEITRELAAEHGFTVDCEGFEEAFVKHREKSKLDSNQTFKGGLADQSEYTTALHTATHLMHQALRDVLGEHVSQKGSNITPDRLRFDFAHPEKMTPDEIRRVEELVNEKIGADLPVVVETMTLQEARDAGALAFFGDRYDEKVKVYSIGDYSREVCGGPHVARTGGMGRFRIRKEQSSSQGVRRIKAVLERS